MKIILKVVLILVSLPLISWADTKLYIYPAVFEPEFSLIAGKPYFLSFYYSNQGDTAVESETHFECRQQNENILCPENNSWLKIQKGKKFTLKPGESQEIKIKIDIPRKANFKNELYETILVIQPKVEQPGVGQSKIIASLGGLLRFKISGKVAWFMTPLYTIQEFGNKLSASMQLAGVDPRTTLIASGALIFILIIFGIFKKIFRLIFRKKTKKPELQPQVQSQAPSEYLPKYFPREIDNRNWKL